MTPKEEESESVSEILSPAQVKKVLNGLGDKPLPFAYGLNADKEPVLVVAKRGKSRDLAKTLKEGAGVKKPAWGSAVGKGGELTLDIESAVPAGMAKGVKKYCQENKVSAFKKFNLTQAGVAAVEEPEEGAAPAPAAPGAGIKGVTDCEKALRDLKGQINAAASPEAGQAAAGKFIRVTELLENRVAALPPADQKEHQKPLADAKAFASRLTREGALADAAGFAEGLAAGLGGAPAADPWGKPVPEGQGNPAMWADDPAGNLPMSGAKDDGGFIPFTGSIGGLGGGAPAPVNDTPPPAPKQAPKQAPQPNAPAPANVDEIEVVQEGGGTWNPTELSEEDLENAPPPAWAPISPEIIPADGPASWKVGVNSVVSIPLKVKIDKNFGPITVQNLILNLEGKVSTPEGASANVGGGLAGDGPGMKVEIPTDILKGLMPDGGSWNAVLKGNVDIAKESGLGCTVEFTNGPVVIEVVFTFVGLDKTEVQPPSASITGGFQISNKPFTVKGVTLYFSGKVSAGVQFAPNWAWISARVGQTVAPAAAAGGAAAGETIVTGMAAVAGAELVIVSGFLLVAASQVFAFYKGVVDIQALKRLQKDADQAVVDFCTGYTAAWTGSGGGSGFWGKLGYDTGAGQFAKDLKDYENWQKSQGNVIPAGHLDQVKAMWRETVASKSKGMYSVAEAMFGKMVRTGVYLQWKKANEGDLRLDSLDDDALVNCGLVRGTSTAPDVPAGIAAAKNANMQLNIDAWAKL